MSEVARAFGARLRSCRHLAGLSQQELAERSELSVRTVSDLERGRTRFPYQASVGRLADALGLRDPARAEFIAAAGRRRAGADAIEDLAHAQRAQPVADPRELGDDFWGSRAELEAFLADLRATRTAWLR